MGLYATIIWNLYYMNRVYINKVCPAKYVLVSKIPPSPRPRFCVDFVDMLTFIWHGIILNHNANVWFPVLNIGQYFSYSGKLCSASCPFCAAFEQQHLFETFAAIRDGVFS